MNQEQTAVRRPSFLNGGSSQEDILKLLDSLDDLAESAPKVFGRVWALKDDEFHMLINKIRASLPDEVRRASRVASDSDKIVSSAREEAEVIIEQAKDEAGRVVEEARQMAAKLVDTSEINRLAKAQAQETMSSADAHARETKRGADEYAREVLASIENHLARVMGTLQKGRERLEVRLNTEEYEEPIIPVGRGARR